MAEPLEIAVKAALCLGAGGALWVAQRLRRRGRPRAAGALAGVCAVVAVAAYYNFGTFQGEGFRRRLRVVHYWEQFHYQLGSRYFPELGYDGLYAASLQAQEETFPERVAQDEVRDLRSNEIVPAERLAAQRAEVKARFTPERWRRFAADHDRFLRANPNFYVTQWRRDHGYNPTPAWTFVARLFNGRGDLGRGALIALSALDPLLMAAAFVAVFRTYGTGVGCASLALFGLGYAGRYYWIGGAYLRLDWLAAAVGAICALERGRPATAGALFAYATAVRVFPIALLFGPGVAAVAAALRGGRPRWPLRLAAGFAAGLLVAAVAGSAAGRGPAAWREFADRIETYRLTASRNGVGLANVVLFGGEILERAASRASASGDWDLSQEEVRRAQRERRFASLASAAALLAVLAAAAWRAPPADAAVMSLAAIFALTPAAGYYWIALLAVPLRRAAPGWTPALLALNALAYGIHLVEPDNLVRYGLYSWMLLLFFAAWLLPAAAATLTRREPA